MDQLLAVMPGLNLRWCPNASPGNGFLTIGARTVVARLLPINAFHAAIFLGRFLYRVAEYLPIMTNAYDRPIRWSWVFAGLQRMAFVTEMLGRFTISEKRSREVLDLLVELNHEL